MQYGIVLRKESSKTPLEGAQGHLWFNIEPTRRDETSPKQSSPRSNLFDNRTLPQTRSRSEENGSGDWGKSPSGDFKSHLEARITKASGFLTLPMMLYSALEKVNYPPSSEIVIHLSCTWAPLCRPKDWETLLHLLPELTALKMILIKQEVLVNNKEVPRMRVRLCEKCKSGRKKLIIDTHHRHGKCLDERNFQIPNFVAVYDYEPMKEVDVPSMKKQMAIWEKIRCLF